jgi:hypothetical protein
LSRRFPLLLLATLLLVQPAYASATKYEYTMSYVMENRGSGPLELPDEDVAVPLFMNTSWQTIRMKDASVPYTVKVMDVDGSRGAVMGVSRTLNPGESSSFTVTFTIESTGRTVPSFNPSEAGSASDIPRSIVDAYSVATETFRSDDPVIAFKAREVVGNADTVLESLELLIEYVTSKTTYYNFEVPRYPNTTLAEGLGDCDDQSILLVSMLRSLGLPAYLQVGIYIHPNINDDQTSWQGHLTNTCRGVGWHGWAIVYVPPWGWVPVDLTLTTSKDGLELLKNAPEYSGNVIAAYDVSKQPYIGDALETRARVIGSDIYVTVTDEAAEVYDGGLGGEAYLVAGLGLAVVVALVFMFVSGRKELIGQS